MAPPRATYRSCGHRLSIAPHRFSCSNPDQLGHQLSRVAIDATLDSLRASSNAKAWGPFPRALERYSAAMSGTSVLAATVTACLVLLASASDARAQSQAAGHPVSGVAVDVTDAVLPHAEVVLTMPSGAIVQTTTTDDTGTFRFPKVSPGRYEVHVSFEGFQPTVARVTVG